MEDQACTTDANLDSKFSNVSEKSFNQVALLTPLRQSCQFPMTLLLLAPNLLQLEINRAAVTLLSSLNSNQICITPILERSIHLKRLKLTFEAFSPSENDCTKFCGVLAKLTKLKEISLEFSVILKSNMEDQLHTIFIALHALPVLAAISLKARTIHEKFSKLCEYLASFTNLRELNIDAYFDVTENENFNLKTNIFSGFTNLSSLNLNIRSAPQFQDLLPIKKVITHSINSLKHLENLSLCFSEVKNGLNGQEFDDIARCVNSNLQTLKFLTVDAPTCYVGNKQFIKFMLTLPNCGKLEELTLILYTTKSVSEEFLFPAIESLGRVKNLRKLKFILHDDQFCLQEKALDRFSRNLKKLTLLQDLEVVVHRKWHEAKAFQPFDNMKFVHAIKKQPSLKRIRLYFGNHIMAPKFLEDLMGQLLMLRSLKNAHVWSGAQKTKQGTEQLRFRFKSHCIFNFSPIYC